jgi:Rrf2 family transcriptional regulator, iron-sulfur cluster assembly transcription factor
MLLSPRSLLGIAAVVDIALHARFGPVAAKALASRHNLPARHLETLLQALVRVAILKGVRGPRGGYELAKERRRISMGDIIRAALQSEDDTETNSPQNRLVESVISPRLQGAEARFLSELDQISIEDMCNEAQTQGVFNDEKNKTADFTI